MLPVSWALPWLLPWLLGSTVPPPAAAAASRKGEGLTVLGGQDVAAHELDHVVGISIRKKYSRTSSLCSGSIINSHWILTAGHCLADTNPSTHIVLVEAGAKRLAEAHAILGEKWFTHERYRYLSNPTRVFYDIALIKLKESVLRVQNTAFAILSRSENDDPSHGSTVEVAGFGIEGEGSLTTNKRGVLKKADMRVKGLCLSTFPYCIKVIDMTGRTCSGDSGGPMVFRGRVVGVSSTGSACTRRRGEAQYTKVSRYNTWITDKINRG